MVNRYCKCCHHLAGRPDAAANFYNDHFIPDRWALHYSKLSECWGVSLMGRCKDCGGDFGGCEERNWFYANRDKRSQFQRSRQFLELFHDWDREQVRLWLEKNFPPEKHTEVFRDTGGSLFSSVIRRAKANGGFDRAGAIPDYHLPCEHESGTDDKIPLTAYEFDFVPIPNYGCEGIYIDCYLKGKFNESGCSSLHVGTLKTLKRDLESAKIMGELCGALMHHANEYVNANLDRYKTDRQLEIEHWQLVEQRRKGGGSGHG